MNGSERSVALLKTSQGRGLAVKFAFHGPLTAGAGRSRANYSRLGPAKPHDLALFSTFASRETLFTTKTSHSFKFAEYATFFVNLVSVYICLHLFSFPVRCFAFCSRT